MRISEQNIGEWAEKYVNGRLGPEEIQSLKQSLESSPGLQEIWKEHLALIVELQRSGQGARLREKLNRGLAAWKAGEQHRSAPAGLRRRLSGYWKPAAASAVLAICSSLLTLELAGRAQRNPGDQYMVLRREIETIKHSQSKIIDSLQKGNFEKPGAGLYEDATYGGTGFALSNEGYIATNYHVVKDANSIFIQTADGENQKAYMVAFEPSSDVAILKVEDQHFSFGSAPLPYAIGRPASGLGQNVFSIGFPQENLVYNEGYISAEAGYDGDSTSYQLELTANPGQSGAPVLDKNGRIIALITGKKSNTSGTTYAVHAESVIRLIQSLPEPHSIKLPVKNGKLKGLERPDQVALIRDYICAVKVN